MIVSKITSKSQTTVPLAVRRALSLRDGDSLVYRIEAGQVILSKAEAREDDPFAVFGEWSGEADCKAYADF